MRVLHTAIKMSLVGVITSLIALELGLAYWLTAGIVGILSISLTKRDSIVSSIKRLVDAIFGIMLATLMFIAFGYTFLVFSIFVFIFALASFQLKIQEGIILSLVLVSHLLLEEAFNFNMIGNELAILFIAVGIAMIFSIIYPQSTEKVLDKHVASIDQLIRDHLFMLSILMKDPEYHEEYYRHYALLDRKISKTIDEVELVDKDLLFTNDHSYLAYFHMRKEQASYIRHMYQHALKLKICHPFALEISDYVRTLASDIGLYDRATGQLRHLDLMMQGYKNSELPQSREEFEVRASLYQILNEIESFLMVKVEFHHSFPEFGYQHIS
ncbi:MAG TPA: aromatic acid exporter family protein [Acholeplasmataceae bacterium]|nr:aromatic acid exporter family protein [Acholeplasmataceae bacterium]